MLLLGHTAAWRAGSDLADLGAHRRLWSDLAVAVNRLLDSRFPLPPGEVLPADAPAAYAPLVIERVQRHGIKPHQFWRTIGARAFLRARAASPRAAYDDPGRALLLSWGFRALDGVSPFLILWLGALAALPLLAWAVWEMAQAGYAVAAGALALLLACSPYFVEALSLTRYAVGFYLVALLALLAFAAYAVMGAVTARGLLLRAAAAGLALALCALCRSSALLLAPGFALAVVLALRRLGAWEWQRRLGAGAAALALLFVPFALARPAEHHGVWSALWEGLGDFDRTYGHAWSDPVAEQVSMAAGAGPLWTEPSEAHFRTAVLSAIANDPAWYGGILIKRAAATVTLHKLWPWKWRQGTPIRRSTTFNEGFIDKYYGYTTTADHLGLGPWRAELPVAALLLPTAVLCAWSVARRRDPTRPRGLALVAVLAAATLVVPIAISTAAAQEAQAFVVVHLLALSLLADALVRRWRRAARGRGPALTPSGGTTMASEVVPDAR